MSGPRTKRTGSDRHQCRRLRLMWRVVPAAVITMAMAVPAARSGGIDGRSVFPLAQRWSASLDDRPVEAPVLADSMAFVAFETAVHAFSLSDGRERWTAKIAVVTEPAAGDGLVFAHTAAGLEALDARSGVERWRADIGPPATPPRWRAGWLVATTGDQVVALRAADGAVIWRTELGSPASAIASFEGNRLYLPLRDGRVQALHVESGEVIWEGRLGGAGAEILALSDRLYVGSEDNQFYCLAATNGRRLWRWRTGADVIGGAVVDRDRVYFVSLDNELRALDRRTGVQRWHALLPTRPIGPPQSVGALFVPLSAGELLFASPTQGTPLLRIPLPAEVFEAARTDPAAEDPVIVVVTTSENGTTELRAFGLAPPFPIELLGEVPGDHIGSPIPLVRTELPVRYLALPGPPGRAG